MSTTQTSIVSAQRICMHLAGIEQALKADAPPSNTSDATNIISDEAQQHYNSLVELMAEPIVKRDYAALDETYREVLRIISPTLRDRLNWVLDQFVNHSSKAESQTTPHTLTLAVAAQAELSVNPYDGCFLDVSPMADHLSKELGVPVDQIAIDASPFSPNHYFNGIAGFLSSLTRTKVIHDLATHNAEKPFMPRLSYDSDDEALFVMVFAVTLHFQTEQELTAASEKFVEYRDRLPDEVDQNFGTFNMQYQAFGHNTAPTSTEVDILHIDLPFSVLYLMLHMDELDVFNEAMDRLVSKEFVYFDSDDFLPGDTPNYQPGQLGVNFSVVAGNSGVLDDDAIGRFEIYDIETKTVLRTGDGPRAREQDVFVENLLGMAIARAMGEVRISMDVVYRAPQGTGEPQTIGA